MNKVDEARQWNEERERAYRELVEMGRQARRERIFIASLMFIVALFTLMVIVVSMAK